MKSSSGMPTKTWRRLDVVGVALTAVSTGCATGHFGEFSVSTFYDPNLYTHIRELGPVQGESCQTKVLYVFPWRSPPSTLDAIEQALSQRDGAVFLGNVSVERHEHWHIGYSRLCTLVTGTAYAAESMEEHGRASGAGAPRPAGASAHTEP
jgi:hypothetical protein